MAIGGGGLRANDCLPNCASGHFHSYPVRAVFSKLEKCGIVSQYNLLTVTIRGTRRPANFNKVETFKFTCG
jgi:hypothetical protein